MSFILDALRKSENARQKHMGPAIAEVPYARKREGRPWWVVLLGVLLLINLGVLVFVLARRPDQPAVEPPAASVPEIPPPATNTPVQAVAAPAQPPVAIAPPVPLEPAAPQPAARATPRGTLADELGGNGLVESVSPPPSPPNLPSREPIVRPLAPSANAPSPGTEQLPSIHDLAGDRAANVPAMHIDIHVYSANPAERFVFINLKKYVEGDTLAEGPVLERIREDGVVLSQGGFRYVVPRQ